MPNHDESVFMALLDLAYFPIATDMKGGHSIPLSLCSSFAHDEVSIVFFKCDLRIGRSK